MKIARGAWTGVVFMSFTILFTGVMPAGDEGEALPEIGKETRITCREFPKISYNILLPKEYDPAKPCAIVYTFSPGGGGMIHAHQSASEATPAIIVGVCGASNNKSAMDYMGEIYAVMLDTLERFNIDPAAQYCGGLSGGAVVSYIVARQYKERICGVMASGGWLQKMYDPWFVYPKGLLVARVSGNNDNAAMFWAKKDMEHLKKAGCKVKDWNQPGGHSVGTPENIKAMMQWLTEEKIADKTLASVLKEKADKWANSPYSETAVREVCDAIRTSPHTKLGNLALRHLFTIMKDDGQFCKVTIPVSAKGPELTGLLGYMAYGAALADDPPRFRSAAYAINKICPDKNSKWRGIIGALYLFSPGDAIVDPVAGQTFVGGCTATSNSPVYNQLVFAAALLKSGKKTDAVKVADKISGKATDPKLASVIANLKKGLKEGESALDARIWLDCFGEGD